MKPVAIHQADVVININKPEQTWTVKESFTCANGKTAVVIEHADKNLFEGRTCQNESDLHEGGYRGYKV